MARYLLTDTWLRAHHRRVTEKEVSRSDGGALEARLRNGAVSFVFRPVLKSGKRIKMTLGRYPEMTLAEAREEALKLRREVEKGRDPRKMKGLI